MLNMYLNEHSAVSYDNSGNNTSDGQNGLSFFAMYFVESSSSVLFILAKLKKVVLFPNYCYVAKT